MALMQAGVLGKSMVERKDSCWAEHLAVELVVLLVVLKVDMWVAQWVHSLVVYSAVQLVQLAD
jgi:hypothetical protein